MWTSSTGISDKAESTTDNRKRLMETIEQPDRVLEEHIVQLRELLVRAFVNDLLYTYILPEPEVRKTWLRQECDFVIRYGYRFGVVVTAPGLTGCGVWLPPGETSITSEREAQINLAAAEVVMEGSARQRWESYLSTSRMIHQQLMPDPHWYL